MFWDTDETVSFPCVLNTDCSDGYQDYAVLGPVIKNYQ